jgi:hypothetical protein
MAFSTVVDTAALAADGPSAVKRPAISSGKTASNRPSVATWGDNSVSSCRSYRRAKGPGTSAGAFPTALSLSGEGPRGPRRGAKGSCGTPRGPLELSAPGRDDNQVPRADLEVDCPGRKPPFLAVKRPARPYKSAIEIDLHGETLRALNRPEAARTAKGVARLVARSTAEVPELKRAVEVAGPAADEVENRPQVTSVVLYFVRVCISPYKPT